MVNETAPTNLIIVTEQLAQIDAIEKALKSTLTLNSYTSNSTTEIKRILSQENIDLIMIDDAASTIGVGAVRNAVNELKMTTPILQLEHADSEQADAEYIKNGASIVCPNDDLLAIQHNTQLLISYSHGQKMLQADAGVIDGYREKFDDLYQGLADPICYLHDGVFIDCNPAFLRTFEVADKNELDELTILNFIDRKHHTELKTHLRKATRRDLSANPVLFTLQTKLGNAVEFALMSKPSTFEGEEVVQVYMRSTSDGGGGNASLYDETTGLSNREQMGFFLAQKIEHFGQNEGSGFLVYLLIKNYRDVWAADGFVEAEKFIKATAGHIRKTMPAHTEVSRYTDDGLLMFVPGGDAKALNELLLTMVRELDALTPEGMVRMVEPVCYVAFESMDKNSDYLLSTSQLFRSARNAAQSEGSSRVSQPTATEVAEKDSRRIELIQDILTEERLSLSFQPIASFEPDGTARYRERLNLFDEEQQKLELDILVNAAERYQLMHRIDKWKLNFLFDHLLGMDINARAHLQVFIAISSDAMRNAGFITWLGEQMQHTGLGGRHFVFELSTDNVMNAYTGAQQLVKVAREHGGKVAVTKIGSLSADNARIIDDIRPDIIKLDLREISTLDDNEEAEIMGDITEKAGAIDAMLIAEYLESPAQLSSIWPYDIKFIQGNGMTPILDDMDFNFDEFAI